MKALLYIIISLVLITGCKTEPKPEKSSEPVKVKLIPVSRETISIPIHSSGTIISNEELKLSFKIGGIVSKIPVKEGDRVKKGDLLASLNLAEIQAKVKQAENAYEKTKRDNERASNLYKDSVATLEQLQNSITAVNVTKADLDIAIFNLEYSRILAPEDGVILKQVVNENELIAPGYPVFLFGTKGAGWKIKAGVTDRDIVRINIGDSAKIVVDAYPTETFTGIVNQVGEFSDPLTGTYRIELSIMNNGQKLASGFIADVEISPSEKKPFFLVPIESIIGAEGNSAYVFVVTNEGHAKKIHVEVGSIFGGRVIVTNGLDSISEIVSEGVAYLKDGDRVSIIK